MHFDQRRWTSNAYFLKLDMLKSRSSSFKTRLRNFACRSSGNRNVTQVDLPVTLLASVNISPVPADLRPTLAQVTYFAMKCQFRNDARATHLIADSDAFDLRQGCRLQRRTAFDSCRLSQCSLELFGASPTPTTTTPQRASMTDLVALGQANARRWENAKLTRNFASVAKHLVEPLAKGRYQTVEAKTGVPWFVIAVIHERESSQDWTGSLAQGDPWNRASVHVPAGRGPFKSWEEAAIDAVVNCPPFAARNKDWSIGGPAYDARAV